MRPILESRLCRITREAGVTWVLAPFYLSGIDSAAMAIVHRRILRAGLVLGAEGQGLFQHLLGAAERLHVVPLFAGGRQPLQTVHIDDLCAAVAVALERRMSGLLTVAEPEPIAMKDFLRAMVRLRGIRCLFVPVPFGPALAALQTAERAGVTLPLRSESLLGLAGMQRVPVEADLARLGVTVRPALESLSALLGDQVAAAPGSGA